jgi:chitinase
MSLTVDQQLLTIQQQSGIRVFTLGFIVSSGGGCSPGWGGLGGSLPTDNTANGTSMLTLINGVRSAGGDVIISFGGAVGQELAQTCTTAASLQAAYQAVINRYNVRMLDFDIEGGAATDSASVTRRNQALRALKAANPGLVISYTLPVLPTGLVSSGLNILNSVKAEGVQVNVVNVMAMDYGPANDNGGRMGQDAIDAAVNTHNQIVAVGLTGTTVGVTPMIGINDVNTEVFQLSDANMLVNFALANGYITRLSFWSVARDNGDCPNQGFASPVCSGIAQNRYQFSQIFAGFR